MPGRILGVGLTGPALTELERKILAENSPYAIVLFARNIESPEQLRDYVAEIKDIADEPPLIMIDQEGGRVDRLRNLIPGLPAAELFEQEENAIDLAREFGRVTGRALRYFDIDVNLAPVVDIRRGEAAKGLERRCFGSDVQTIVDLAGAFIEGEDLGGVGSCLKHFPGLGGGTADPHYGASVVDLPYETVELEDLAPYRALGEKAGAVMIGHAIYPLLDGKNDPATLSRVLSTELLRDRLGFKGIAISDDMEMHAVSDLASYEEIAIRALIAGNDVVLFCSQIERVPELLRAFDERASIDREFAQRVEEASDRALVYRRHVQGLANRAARAASFEQVLAEAAAFRASFDAARWELGPDGEKIERRNEPREGGTGKTGREEWT